ncbi:hypothetical protein D3C87_1662990 [compost metagenome]
MRQHRRAGDVADGPDALDIGLAIAVDDNGAALGLDANRFQPKPLDIALHADGRDQLVTSDLLGLAVLGLDMGDDAVLGLFDLGDLGFGQELDAALFQPLAGEARNLGIFHRQDLRQELDDRHIGAQRAIEGGKLDADGARTHDDEALRHFGGLQRLEIGPDLVAIRLDAR